MSKTFNTKVIECDSGEVYNEMNRLETEWLSALLLRAGVSKVLINKALTSDTYSAAAWRDYLFDDFGITITKHLGSKDVEVFQISFETGERVKIGEWTKPGIVRKKETNLTCKLELKYWQII